MCRKRDYHKTSNTQIDICMRPLIKFLQEEWKTVACCCGHGRYPITVVVETGHDGENYLYEELFTGIQILRTRRFYKKDEQGYYYIPETLRGKDGGI